MGEAFDKMGGADFGLMGAESAAAMMDSMGFDHALAGGGEQMAGIMGAMDTTGMSQFDPGQMTQAFDMMSGTDFGHMGAESAAAMMDSIGFDHALAGGGEQMAGIMGAMDATGMSQFDPGQMTQAFDVMSAPT